MAKQSLKHIAYTSIKDKILNCEYKPNSFLNEDILCEEFQMSRTPIRDALGRLEQEHLIIILPKKGFFVAPLSFDEINMVFEGRLLIEPYIIMNYCQDFPLELLESMKENLKLMTETLNGSRQKMYSLDNNFHSCIINQCTNRYLIQTYSDIHNQNCRLRIISGQTNERLKDTLQEHTQILERLNCGALPAAAEAMRTHLIRSREASFQAFIEGAGKTYL